MVPGASFSGGGRAGRVYGPSPSIYDFNFSPVSRTFETVLLLQEQHMTVTCTETPNDLLK